MDEKQRREIMAEARRHVANRTEYLPRDPDAIATAWRTSKPTPEPDPAPLRYRTTQTEHAVEHSHQWTDFVRREITSAIASEHALVIELLGLLIANERDNFENLIEEQRREITELRTKVEVETSRLEADVAHLRVDILRAAADRERGALLDLPSWPRTTKPN
jgi:hypothetical protein